MSKFTLEIKTGNAAFEDDPGAELARILRDLAEGLEFGETAGTLRDYNGNAVGSYSLSDGE